MYGLITINGHEYPAPDYPATLRISTNVSGGRNSATGEFAGQVIGRNQYKIENLQWKFLDASIWASILQEFAGFVAYVKIPDMQNNSWIALEMCPSDRTADPLPELDPATGLPRRYANCKVNIIDCGVI